MESKIWKSLRFCWWFTEHLHHRWGFDTQNIPVEAWKKFHFQSLSWLVGFGSTTAYFCGAVFSFFLSSPFSFLNDSSIAFILSPDNRTWAFRQFAYVIACVNCCCFMVQFHSASWKTLATSCKTDTGFQSRLPHRFDYFFQRLSP